MKFLDLAWQHNQIPYLKEKIFDIIEKGSFVLSEEVANFEREWANYIGTKYCIGVNSGTDAISLALRAIGIGAGDKVIVQTNTFAATVYAIIQNQGAPLFIDIDKEYGCINLRHLKEVVHKEKPKAIILVHLYGQACYGSQVADIAKENNIFLIEDCAQAHGAKWEGKKAGTFGDISCFSFFPSKNLGAMGDAGALCTDNEEYAEKIIRYRNIGSKIKNMHETEWGGNSRLDALQAAVLLLKLRYLDIWNEKRRNIANMYRERLEKLPLLIYKEHPSAYNIYHQFVIIVEDREKLRDYLSKFEIPTLIHYPSPCHSMKPFIKYALGTFPVAEWINKRHLSLPMSPHLSEDDVAFVCKKIEECLKDEKKPEFYSER